MPLPKQHLHPDTSTTETTTLDTIALDSIVPLNRAGLRLDQVAAELFPEHSRSRLKSWIIDGKLRVDGHASKPKTKLGGGEHLQLNVDVPVEGEWLAQDIPLDCVFEDESLLVVNKPPGIVVHPGSGNWDGTLLNGLLHYLPAQRAIPRAGIVHRLDKDTSGLMVIAKTLEAQTLLVQQLQERSVSRQYQALVLGRPDASGSIDAPLGRHSTQRTKMAVLDVGGKRAVTHYQRLASEDGISLMQLKLETGRTHQIRVHMAHAGHPLVGDPVYGRKLTINERNAFGISMGQHADQRAPAIDAFSRQALHAEVLGLQHPKTLTYCQWRASPPSDFFELLSVLIPSAL